ncbi:Lipase, putative [Seminavis robusta]|uniref:Lipase, putative n=1 Tax=Seminavis robusta TaxID=568900 RepID=A0A9N8EL32_9STRA|nr:Lipase, putative [Seminavis robusta]|eukprot:Sro1178_g249520.1 Lipase, putative (411) ;mRNA; r:23605-24970
MAPKSKFLLKDSPPEVIQASDGAPKGRSYNASYAKQPGGVRVDDLVVGMKLASLAITDNKPKTLKNTAKSNPWQEEAMTMIAGSREAAHKPLSELLKTLFNLDVDCVIDVSGIKQGRALDTQGFIAHNDEMIVLSYRCTTSALDWITNLSTTSSEWEPDVDIELGHAGWCSCILGYGCLGGSDQVKKPRVHTGFYNNFIHSTPMILEHIKPLLTETEKPRKLYVCGHSLGAGIATLAAIYFLLEFEWELLPQKLIMVTAGSPRACTNSMGKIVKERLAELRPMDKAFFCRIVLNEDVVSKVPPSGIGYTHVGRLVYITKDGEILINPSNDHILDADDVEIQKLIVDSQKPEQRPEEENDDSSSTLKERNEKYEKMLKMIPGPFKDHMPDFYLQPLVRLFEKEKNGATFEK